MGLVWASIRVTDLKKSVEFYTKLMGMKVVGRRSHVPGERIVSLVSEDTGQRLNLMWYSKTCTWYTPYKKDGSEMDHLMFEVKDARKAYERLVAKGAPAATELWGGERKGGWAMGFVKDPSGIWVGVMSKGEK